MAAAHVQHKLGSGYFDGLSTVTVTLDSAVAIGNIVCGTVSWSNPSFTLTSITDNLGNTYVTVDDVTTGAVCRSVTYYGVIMNGGICTITATMSGASDAKTLIAHEASGLDTSVAPLHTGKSENPSSGVTDDWDSGIVLTTVDGSYIYGSANDMNYSTSKSAGTGFDLRTTNGAGASDTASESRIQAVAGSVAATWTEIGFCVGNAMILAFQPAAGAVPPSVAIYLPTFRRRRR